MQEEIARSLYDVIITGGGPAGLFAAIYMARARYRVLVMEKEKIDGQITIVSEIVNYPGVRKASGKELTESTRLQAEAFDTGFAIGEVVSMELGEEMKILHATKDDSNALGVIIATGANPRKLDFKGEKELQDRGAAYCATCDGGFFTGMEVFVIGGGFAAVGEGLFLTQYAKEVIPIVREEDFTYAKTVSDQLKRSDKIAVHFQTEIMEVKGASMMTSARFRDNETGGKWTYESEEGFGVFVSVGYVPSTGWLGEEIQLDDQGHVITDASQKTNLDGTYAAGDLCVKDLRQIVTTVSDDVVATVSMEKYVAKLHDGLEIPELVRRRADLSRLEWMEETADKSEMDRPSGQTSSDISAGSSWDNDNRFLDTEIRARLESLLPKSKNRIYICTWLGDTSLSGEIKGFLSELTEISGKIIWEGRDSSQDRLLPAIELCYEDGTGSGMLFHGVPGGHKFSSFIIALYNVTGPGQQTDTDIVNRLKNITRDRDVKVMISLSYTMYPEAVMTAQKAASISPHITAEMADLMRYPELKKKYRVVGVPCMVVNNEGMYFGKKSLKGVVEIIEETGA